MRWFLACAILAICLCLSSWNSARKRCRLTYKMPHCHPYQARHLGIREVHPPNACQAVHRHYRGVLAFLRNTLHSLKQAHRNIQSRLIRREEQRLMERSAKLAKEAADLEARRNPTDLYDKLLLLQDERLHNWKVSGLEIRKTKLECWKANRN